MARGPAEPAVRGEIASVPTSFRYPVVVTVADYAVQLVRRISGGTIDLAALGTLIRGCARGQPECAATRTNVPVADDVAAREATAHSAHPRAVGEPWFAIGCRGCWGVGNRESPALPPPYSFFRNVKHLSTRFYSITGAEGAGVLELCKLFPCRARWRMFRQFWLLGTRRHLPDRLFVVFPREIGVFGRVLKHFSRVLNGCRVLEQIVVQHPIGVLGVLQGIRLRRFGTPRNQPERDAARADRHRR